MSTQCLYKPQKHQLWDELGSVFGKENRTIIKYWYNVAHDEEFLKLSDGIIQLNDEGEPSITSLMKAAKTTKYKSQIENMLQQKVGTESMPYSVALNTMSAFNRTNPNRSEYLATLVFNQDGKVNVVIVPNTSENRRQLADTIKKRTLAQRLQYRLASLGVNAEFITMHDGVQGRYSTENVERTEQGLLTLISISNGAENVDETMAEESGHFALAALGDNPLAKRLEQLCTQEVQDRVFKDKPKKYVNADPARETAGNLIGQALISKLEHSSALGKLAYRISNLTKTIFAKITRNQIKQDRLEAERIAYQIAGQFLSDEFEGTTEEALKQTETLYDANTSSLEEDLLTCIASLTKLKKDLYVLNSKEAKDVERHIRTIKASQYPDTIRNSQFYNTMVKEGLATTLASVLALSQDIQIALQQLPKDFSNTTDFENNLSKYSSSLQMLRYYHTTLESLCNVLSNYSGNHITITYNYQMQTMNVSQLLSEVRTKLNEFNTNLSQSEKAFFLKMCESVLGRSYILKTAKIIFHKGRLRKTVNQRFSLASKIDYLTRDVTWLGRMFGTLSRSNSIINQIMKKAFDSAKAESRAKTIKAWDTLRDLKKQMFDLKITDPTKFYETTDKGGFTGNILDFYNHDKYDQLWKQFKDKHIEEFNSRGNNQKLMRQNRELWEVHFNDYFTPIRNTFFADTHIKVGDSWVLSDFFINWKYVEEILEYKGRNPDQARSYYRDAMFEHPAHYPKAQFLNQYIKLKKELDKNLPEGSTPWYRLPQVRGSVTDRFKNHLGDKSFDNRFKATSSFIIDTCRYLYTLDSTDGDYGSDMTYNYEDDFLLTDPAIMVSAEVDRVPLYAINKLQNPNAISKDLFRATLIYADMACNYGALDKIVHAFEVGQEVLKRRQIAPTKYQKKTSGSKKYYATHAFGTRTEFQTGKDGKHTNAYRQYVQFLSHKFYGNPAIIEGLSLTKAARNMANRIVGNFSGLFSTLLLGQSVSVAFQNEIDGLSELFKEGNTGRHFTKRQIAKATVKALGFLIPYVFNTVIQKATRTKFKDSKVFLLLREFNILDDFTNNARDWNTSDRADFSQGWNFWMFFPMTLTNLHVSLTAFFAMSDQYKVYYKPEGATEVKRISLEDAYEVYDTRTDRRAEDAFGNLGMSSKKVRSLRVKEGVYINAVAAEKQEKIKEVRSKIEDIRKNIKYKTDDESIDLNNPDHDMIFLELRDLYKIMQGDTQGISLLQDVRKKNAFISPIPNWLVEIFDTYSFDKQNRILQDNNFSVKDIRNIINKLTPVLNNVNSDLSFNNAKIQFQEQYRGVINGVAGIYDTANKGMFSADFYWAMWSVMKGYVWGLAPKRFAGNIESILNEQLMLDEDGQPIMVSIDEKGQFKEKRQDDIYYCSLEEISTLDPQKARYKTVLVWSETDKTWQQYDWNNAIQKYEENPNTNWDEYITGESESSMSAALKSILNMFSSDVVSNLGMLLFAALPVSTFNNKGIKLAQKAGFSEEQFRALKFFYADLYMTILVNLAYNALRGSDDDEPEEVWPLNKEQNARLKLELQQDAEYQKLLAEKESKGDNFIKDAALLKAENRVRQRLNLPIKAYTSSNMKYNNPWKDIKASDFKKDIKFKLNGQTYTAGEYIAYFKEEWNKGNVPINSAGEDFNVFQFLLDNDCLKSSDSQSYYNLVKASQYYESGQNISVDHREVNPKGIFTYFLGRTLKNTSAFCDVRFWNDDASATQEYSNLLNLAGSTILNSGIMIIGEIAAFEYQRQAQKELVTGHQQFLEKLNTVKQSSKEWKKQSLNDALTILIADYKKQMDETGTVKFNNFAGQEEYIKYLVENNLSTRQNIEKEIKKGYYTDHRQGHHKKWQSKVSRSIDKIIPVWWIKNNFMLHEGTAALDSYLFAVKTKTGK